MKIGEQAETKRATCFLLVNAPAGTNQTIRVPVRHTRLKVRAERPDAENGIDIHVCNI